MYIVNITNTMNVVNNYSIYILKNYAKMDLNSRKALIMRLIYMPYNEKKKNYDIAYAKEKLKRIPLDVQKDKYDQIKEHAEKHNETVNGFIKRAIDRTIEEDNNNG